MWEDIRAPQRFEVNRGLVKWIWEELIQDTEVSDWLVEKVAAAVEETVVRRMAQNMSIPPLMMVIWGAIESEECAPDEAPPSDSNETTQLKDLATEFERQRDDATRQERVHDEEEIGP